MSEYSNVLEYLHSVFDGWMQFNTYYNGQSGHYAVHKDRLLFFVMTHESTNYARIELCNVNEPDRRRAHEILSEVIRYCIEHFGGWAWVYTHEDRQYAFEMTNQVDICCGRGGHPIDSVHLYNGSRPLDDVLRDVAKEVFHKRYGK